jgi:hypothetical protein
VIDRQVLSVIYKKKRIKTEREKKVTAHKVLERNGRRIFSSVVWFLKILLLHRRWGSGRKVRKSVLAAVLTLTQYSLSGTDIAATGSAHLSLFYILKHFRQQDIRLHLYIKVNNIIYLIIDITVYYYNNNQVYRIIVFQFFNIILLLFIFYCSL